MNLLVSLAELPRVLLNKLFAHAGNDSPLPDCGWGSVQEKQFATDSREPVIERLNIFPTNHARADAVSQMQRIDKHETPRLRVLLHAFVQPFDHAHDALVMTLVCLH